MRTKGREEAEVGGFAVPDNGWYQVCIQEGIDKMKNKEGEVIKDKKGADRFVIPLLIDDSSDFNGARLSIPVSMGTSFGEQILADIVLHTGMEAKFNENFPGDVSYWDEPVLNAFKAKMPGKFIQVRVEKSKDDKYANVVQIYKVNAAPPEKGKGGKKGDGGSSAKETASSAPKASDW